MAELCVERIRGEAMRRSLSDIPPCFDREGPLQLSKSTSNHRISATQDRAVACIQGRQRLAFQYRRNRPLARRPREEPGHVKCRIKCWLEIQRRESSVKP